MTSPQCAWSPRGPPDGSTCETVVFGRERAVAHRQLRMGLFQMSSFPGAGRFFAGGVRATVWKKTRADATVRLVASPAVVQTIWSRCMCASLLAQGRKHPHICVEAVRSLIWCVCYVLAAMLSNEALQTMMGQLQEQQNSNLAVLACQQMEEAVLQIIARVRNTNQVTDSRRSSRARTAATLWKTKLLAQIRPMVKWAGQEMMQTTQTHVSNVVTLNATMRPSSPWNPLVSE